MRFDDAYIMLLRAYAMVPIFPSRRSHVRVLRYIHIHKCMVFRFDTPTRVTDQMKPTCLYGVYVMRRAVGFQYRRMNNSLATVRIWFFSRSG